MRSKYSKASLTARCRCYSKHVEHMLGIQPVMPSLPQTAKQVKQIEMDLKIKKDKNRVFNKNGKLRRFHLKLSIRGELDPEQEQ